MYILKYYNNDTRYNKIYNIIISREPDQPCNGICDTPLGFSTSCKQKFVQKRLVALQGTGDNLYVDVFWFPHCCSCNIARVEQ